MIVSEKYKLMKEYAKNFSTTFRILEATGFCRFIIRNGKIVARNWPSMLYNMLVLALADVAVTAMLWTTNRSHDALTTVEFITIVHFTIFANLLMFHITFGDQFRGPDLVQNCIDIDIFLGAKETKFLRELLFKMYTTLVVLVGFTQLGIVIYLYFIFHVTFLIHVTGSLFFFWIFFAYDDFCFYLISCTFVTSRARYLNVALLNFTNMKLERISKQSFFYIFFWHDEYDHRVNFHVNAESQDFVVALKMLFHQVRHIERCFAWPMIGGLFTVVMGSFVAVQTFIMYIEVSTAMTRASAIAGWAIGTWAFILLVSVFTDMFNTQIEQTKLICAYVQLKPSSSVEMLKLTRDIISSLELRDARISLYGAFYLDTGLIFKLAASTLVYITVQLQMALPHLDNGHKAENGTKPASIEEFVFLY